MWGENKEIIVGVAECDNTTRERGEFIEPGEERSLNYMYMITSQGTPLNLLLFPPPQFKELG